jgi:hypothetical protein
MFILQHAVASGSSTYIFVLASSPLSKNHLTTPPVFTKAIKHRWLQQPQNKLPVKKQANKQTA